MAWKANTSSTTKRRVMVVADPTAESMGALQYVLSHAVHDNDDLILIHILNPKKGPSIKSLIFRRHSDPGSGTISTFDPTIASNNEGGSCRGGSVGGGIGGGGIDFLETMKRVCKGMYPNSRVWIEKVELRSLYNNNNNMGNDNNNNMGNDNNNNNNNNNKGALILLKCKELSVDLLVVGQRRHLVSVLLGPTRSLSGASSWGSSKSVDMVEYLIENSPCTCVAVQKKGQNSGYILNSRTHTNFWLLV